jgi:site-specific DNA-methyltransferase (adenine-specific)/modification methylase
MPEKVVIGKAELWLGDCREVLPMLPTDGLIVSDPPYGIGYQHGGGGQNAACTFTGHRLKPIPHDTRAIFGDDQPFDPAIWIKWPSVLLWGADHFRARLPESGTMLAWDKSVGIGPADSFTDAEFAWTSKNVKRNVFRHLWKGVDRWWAEEDSDKPGTFDRKHTAQKPLPLMRWCIEMLKPRPGSVIIDPYMGSGSTGVAAISLGFGFVGCEIDPDHFEVACDRLKRAQQRMGMLGNPLFVDETA